jgi:hypothetical protein
MSERPSRHVVFRLVAATAALGAGIAALVIAILLLSGVL